MGNTSSTVSTLDHKKIDKLLNKCKEIIDHAAQLLGETDGRQHIVVINRHQSAFLLERLSCIYSRIIGLKGSRLYGYNATLLLEELLQIFMNAETLIKASCTRRSRWLRTAFEHGSKTETFSELLHDVFWYASILQSERFNLEGCSGLLKERVELDLVTAMKEDELDLLTAMKEVELDLLTAMKKDEESLKHRLKRRLRCVKLDDRKKQRIAQKLLNHMEGLSGNLIQLSSYEFDHKGSGLIGHGTFGSVLEAQFLDCECAMKVFEVSKGNQRSFEQEMNALQKVGHHPNLVRLFFYTMSAERCCLIMERMQMDLSKCIRDYGHSLSIVAAVTLMLEIGEGMKHIHRKGMAHRDLKPENVLINLQDDPSNNNLTRICSVKIADFGTAKVADMTRSNQSTGTGTTMYMAPEVIKGKADDPVKVTYNPLRADVYSFGIVCSMILTRTVTPYEGIFPMEVKQRVINGSLRPGLPKDCPRRLAMLIANCWGNDFHKRPLFPEICRELRYIKSLLLTGCKLPLNIPLDGPQIYSQPVTLQWSWGPGVQKREEANHDSSQKSLSVTCTIQLV